MFVSGRGRLVCYGFGVNCRGCWYWGLIQYHFWEFVVTGFVCPTHPEFDTHVPGACPMPYPAVWQSPLVMCHVSLIGHVIAICSRESQAQTKTTVSQLYISTIYYVDNWTAICDWAGQHSRPQQPDASSVIYWCCMNMMKLTINPKKD